MINVSFYDLWAVVNNAILDHEKYKKEALALGRLVAPVKTLQVAKNEEIKKEMPNNNPFKRRKLEVVSSEELEYGTEAVSMLPVFVEASPDILCSSPESQVTVETKPPLDVSSRKQKIQNKSVSKSGHTSTKSEKTGILKFFERL